MVAVGGRRVAVVVVVAVAVAVVVAVDVVVVVAPAPNTVAMAEGLAVGMVVVLVGAVAIWGTQATKRSTNQKKCNLIVCSSSPETENRGLNTAALVILSRR